MHLKSLTIRNFRGLEDIQVEFDNRVNVIVGPNAIGKTTVLEAIRLAKAMLSPRTLNEPTQALFALGAATPHMPQRLILPALARDPGRSVEILCQDELNASELDWIDSTVPQVAMNLIQARMGQAFSNPANLIAFLSSDEGKTALAQAETAIRESLKTSAGAEWYLSA